MKAITDAGDLKGKYVVLRASLNLPVADGVVTNEYRLKQALPTLRYLNEAGARTIVVGHIGRDPEETLMPVYETLAKHIPVQWGGVLGTDECTARRELMADGDLLMLENTRQDDRYKDLDQQYDEQLAALGDLFVFDAFPVAHREQASTTGIAQHLPSYAGLTMLNEVQQLGAMLEPTSPSLFLLGGAKFDTKMPLVEKYLELYDHVFIGGALMNDVFKAKGYEVGVSKLSDTDLTGAAFLDHPNLIIPIDVLVSGPAGDRVCTPTEVQPDEAMLDIGPETVKLLVPLIDQAASILWNGPFGNYEGGYGEATDAVAQLVADSSATSVLGGGDTVAAVEKLGLNDQFTHVSTGGGAMLLHLEHGTLPVIEALS